MREWGKGVPPGSYPGNRWVRLPLAQPLEVVLLLGSGEGVREARRVSAADLKSARPTMVFEAEKRGAWLWSTS